MLMKVENNPIFNYKYILLGFSILFLLRICSEIPLALNNIGWLSFQEKVPITKVLTFSLTTYSAFFILIYSAKISKRWAKILLIFIFILLVSSILCIMNISKLSIPISAYLTSLFRFLSICIFILFMTSFIKEYRDILILKRYLFNPLVFICISLGILQLVTGSYHNIQGVSRLVGPFSNPNVFAAYLNVLIIIHVVFNMKRGKLKFALVFLLLEVVLFATGSITMIFANSVFLIGLIVHKRLHKKIKSLKFIPFLILLITIVFFLNLESILHRLSILIDLKTFSLAEASSLKWRIDAWGHYLERIDNFIDLLLGKGLGYHRIIFLNGLENNLSYIFKAPGTHNDYLAILIDFGLVGLFCFIILILFLFKEINVLQNREEIKIFKIGFFSFLIAMTMDNYIDNYSFWIFLILLSGMMGFCKLDNKNYAVENSY